MKITLKILASFLVVASTFFLSSCGGDDPKEPTVEEKQLTKLSSTWKVSSATLDGTAQTGYQNFTLTLSGTAGATSFGYTTSGRPSNSPWPTSGNWIFGANPETQIVRDADKTSDKLDMTYSVSDTQLQVTFNFSGTGYPARTANVKGTWIFTFTK